MTDINNSNHKSFIAQMSEQEKLTFLKVLVALAKCDSDFDDDEKAYIKETAIVFGLTKEHVNEILTPMTDEDNFFV